MFSTLNIFKLLYFHLFTLFLSVRFKWFQKLSICCRFVVCQKGLTMQFYLLYRATKCAFVEIFVSGCLDVFKLSLLQICCTRKSLHNTLPHTDAFRHLSSRRILKTYRQNGKVFTISNFSLCHDVFQFYSIIVPSFLEGSHVSE